MLRIGGVGDTFLGTQKLTLTITLAQTSDVVLETRVLVLRCLEDKIEMKVLVLDHEVLVLVLNIWPFIPLPAWSWYRS